jgi:hypothetical protein
VLISDLRQGPVRAIPVENKKVTTLKPVIDQAIDKKAHLMSDSHRSYYQYWLTVSIAFVGESFTARVKPRQGTLQHRRIFFIAI